MGQELVLLAINHIFPRVQIRRQGRMAFGLGEPLVSKNHDQVERNPEISRDEIDVVELLAALAAFFVDEHVEIFENGNQDAKDQGEIGPPQTKGGRVRQAMLFDALGAARLHEVNVRHEDGDPGQDAENRHQVDEILEDRPRIVGHVEKGDAGDQRRQAQGVDGHAAAVRAREDGEGIPLLGETVQGPGGNVQVAVRGGEDEDEDEGVQEPGQPRDAALDHGHDKGRRGCAGLGFVGEDQVLIVVRHQGADQEHRDDVKDDDAPKREFDGSRDHFAGVLGLAHGDAYQFRSTSRSA